MDVRLVIGWSLVISHVCGLWQNGYTGRDETWQAA